MNSNEITQQPGETQAEFIARLRKALQDEEKQAEADAANRRANPRETRLAELHKLYPTEDDFILAVDAFMTKVSNHLKGSPNW